MEKGRKEEGYSRVRKGKGERGMRGYDRVIWWREWQRGKELRRREGGGGVTWQ